MNRNYVSDFTLFMNQYLKDHPEVVADQQRGRDIYWNPAAAHHQQPVSISAPGKQKTKN